MKAEFKPTNLVKNLPDAYAKSENSNNFKILEVERRACNDLRQALQEIDSILDINNARGKTLDFYGERVGQARGLADDSQYLLMIKAKIMRNLSNGSHGSIINALCMTLNCEPSQVVMIDGEEPCTIDIIALPLAIINTAGFTTAQTLAIIEKMLPVGVSIASFNFEGTFEFSNNENEYSEDKGFCDVEGDTIGGYLSAIAGDENDITLPI